MKNELRYTAIVLLLAQVFNLLYVLYFWSSAESGWAKLGWFFLGSMVLVWFMGLIVFTAIILYKGNEQSAKKDRAALIVIGVLTFFSVMLSFGGIS